MTNIETHFPPGSSTAITSIQLAIVHQSLLFPNTKTLAKELTEPFTHVDTRIKSRHRIIILSLPTTFMDEVVGPRAVLLPTGPEMTVPHSRYLS